MLLRTLFITGFWMVLMHSGAWAESEKRHDPILGLWLTEDHDAVVEFYPCEEQICGRFRWVKPSDGHHNSHDVNNHDPAKRPRSLCNQQFIGGFVLDGQNHYTNGWIYNPEDGSTYEADMTLANVNVLDLHGYLVLPIFGQSQTWTRVTKAPACAEVPS